MYSTIFKKVIRFSIALSLLLMISGFSFSDLFGGKQEPAKNTPEGLYSRASIEYNKGNYKKAQEYFLRVKEEYPLHDMAVLAEIGVADSMYSNKEYAAAENAYSDFISLHPVNENVPYAIYQLGLCHYNQMEDIDRDQAETIAAKKEWEKLIARYPESKFSTMSEKMVRECKKRLAEREFYVGKFYLKQDKYKAALARFEYVASNYANVGLDYKIEYYINETKAKIAEEEKLKLKKEAEKDKIEKKKVITNQPSLKSLYWSEDSAD